MKNKGQINTVGVILVGFVTVLLGVILFQAIAQQIGSTTTTEEIGNVTVAVGAAGTSITLANYRAVTDVIITNGTTGSVIVPASNYTINNNQVVNGALATTIDVGEGNFTNSVWRVQGTGQPLTYIPDSGGRAIASLIAIFFALAVLIVSITPVMQEKFLSMIGR